MTYADAIEAAQLTKLQRRYLDLYLDGHPIRTIARANGTSAANVRGHIDAALTKIKRTQEEAHA